MFKNHIKILVIVAVVLMSHFFVNDTNANIDGAYCIGTQGYVYEKTTDISCTGNGLPSGCAAGQGVYYPPGPQACSLGEVVVGHHFTMTCPDCRPEPSPCVEGWNEWSNCSEDTCQGGTRTRTSICGTKDDESQDCSVNGICGSKYDDATTVQVIDHPIQSNSSDLCAAGAVSNFTDDGNGGYTWTCVGTGDCLDASCDAQYNETGECSTTAVGEYNWNDTEFDGDLCVSGVVSEPTPIFPGYDQTVTWNCLKIGNDQAQSDASCSATRNGPQPGKCSEPSNKGEFEDAPTTNLCCDPDILSSCVVDDSYATPNILTNLININTQDNVWGWNWRCNGSRDGEDRFVDCQAICKPTATITTSPDPIQLPQDGSSIVNITISAGITGDCAQKHKCIVTYTDGSSIEQTIELTSDVPSQDITVDLSGTLTVNCPGMNADEDGNENGDGNVDISVNGYCLERACNAQGTCQAIPKSGITSTNDCQSSCSSNADCTSGRLIETRP